MLVKRQAESLMHHSPGQSPREIMSYSNRQAEGLKQDRPHTFAAILYRPVAIA